MYRYKITPASVKAMLELSKSTAWMDNALCAKPEYKDYPWFPPTGNHWRKHQILCQRAIAVCHACPVMTECKAYADISLVTAGIWGGQLYGLTGEG